MATPDFFIDGIGSLEAGINSGIVPQLLPPNQASFATNATFRGGFARCRPALGKKAINFGGDDLLQRLVTTSLWQGGAYFKSEYGEEGMVVSIGGRIFFFVVALSAAIEVRDVTPQTNGADDPNSNGNPIAWIWQAERWAIISDGEKLPIFFDGATSRRSRGAAKTLGTTNGNFVAPAINAAIAINLLAPYAGSYNDTIYIGSALYQVNSSGVGYEITLKNLSQIEAETVPAGTQFIFPSNFIGQFTQDETAKLKPITPGGPQGFYLELTHVTPALTLPINKADDKTYSVLRTSFAGTPEYVTGKTESPNHKSDMRLGWANLNAPTVFKNAPLYLGNFAGTSPTGMITSADFAAPAVGGTITLLMGVPYYGTIGSKVTLNGALYEITAVNNTPVPTTAINVTNLTDTPGATVASGAILKSVSEMPICRMGVYGMGRNWISLADGRSFIGSDIVGGSSGTPALNRRDSVLRFTENDYLSGGGVFVIPGNVGDITSMTFTATLDVALGQGPLQIGTPNSIFSCMAPVDRLTWQTMTNPILTQSLIGKGPLGQYGTININSDTIFRELDGIGSLILAKREFTTWGNTPISREVQRVIDEDDESLLQNATAIDFDNRLIMGCLAFSGPLGVFHRGIIAMNFDPISSLRGKAPAIYDGLWTGVNAFQFVRGRFGNEQRAFAFCFNAYTTQIELWELLKSNDADHFDNESQPITWSFESASLFQNIKGKGQYDPIELRDGELYFSDIKGTVFVQVWYRADSNECWSSWKDFGICANNLQSNEDPKQFRSRVGLGVPPSTICEPTNNRPTTIGNNFQVRFQITGDCKFMGAQFKAIASSEVRLSRPLCNELCATNGAEAPCEPCRDTGDCLRFKELVFYSLTEYKLFSNELLAYQITGGDGTPQTVYIDPGKIIYHQPYPPDEPPSNPPTVYPPLTLTCGDGTITRSCPAGASQAEIDAIVESMMSECGLNQANPPTTGGPGSPPTLLPIPDQACLQTLFSASLTATGSVELSGGTLPPGISISGTSLSGTPTTAGDYSFTIRATNGVASTARAYTIHVLGFTTLQTLPCAIENKDYSKTIDAVSSTPVLLAITAGALPAGLTLNVNVIEGQPTEAGTFNFTITVTDEAGRACDKAFTLKVDDCITNPAQLPNVIFCTPYVETLIAGCEPTDGHKFRFTIIDGALPVGMILDSDTGKITGNSFSPGTYTFTVQVDEVPI